MQQDFVAVGGREIDGPKVSRFPLDDASGVQAHKRGQEMRWRERRDAFGQPPERMNVPPLEAVAERHLGHGQEVREGAVLAIEQPPLELRPGQGITVYASLPQRRCERSIKRRGILGRRSSCRRPMKRTWRRWRCQRGAAAALGTARGPAGDVPGAPKKLLELCSQRLKARPAGETRHA